MGTYDLTTEHACIYPFIIYSSTYCQLLLLSSIISILTMMCLVVFSSMKIASVVKGNFLKKIIYFLIEG